MKSRRGGYSVTQHGLDGVQSRMTRCEPLFVGARAGRVDRGDRSRSGNFWTTIFQYCPHRLEACKRLVRQWIFCADLNSIFLSTPQQSFTDYLPSFRLEDIPYGRMYLTMIQITTLYGDIWQYSDIVIDVLRPESASDIKEVAPWIHNL